VEYNRGLYVSPNSPQLTKGTKAADGSWKTPPRLSKSVTKFDLMTYMEFCRSPEAVEVDYRPEGELVDKLIANEMNDDWWRRHLRPVNLTVVKQHLRATARHDVRATELAAAPTTAMPSPGEACRWCDFRALCMDEFFGNRPDPLVPSDYGLRVSRRGPEAEDVQA
jgi:hypothetical protein